MSDTTHEQQDALLKAWKALNIQADTLLKLSQARAVPWQIAIGGVTAGAALFAAAFAFAKVFT
jgi:hypothetical protein